jgi:endonuclease/exonuclease/phosphatase family metal-dependent hydrolase
MWFKLIFMLILTILFGSCTTEITIMSYNVQTLFDDVDDGTEYPAYDPGSGKWNSELFQLKLKAIGRVIKEAFLSCPDIVALQEVENSNTLDTLNTLILKECRYAFAVLVPAPGASTNTAILSRYPIRRVRAHNTSQIGLRSILEVEISINGHILYLFNNHWKSHTDGSMETEASRLETAFLLRRRIITILEADPPADIIVVGDFNENVEEYYDRKMKYQTAFIPFQVDVPAACEEKSIFLTSRIEEVGFSGNKLILLDLWYELPSDRWGSYVFNHKWFSFDHVLLTGGLLNRKGIDYMSNSFSVIHSSFLVDKKNGYPLKWQTHLKKGYSDHLPLLVKVKVINN